jgi:hypothetical protein
MSKHSEAVRAHFIILKIMHVHLLFFWAALQRNELSCFCSFPLHVMLMKQNSVGIQTFTYYAGNVLLVGDGRCVLNLQHFLFEKLR